MTQPSYSRTIRRLAGFLCLCAVVLSVAAARSEDSSRWYKGNTHAHSLWSDGDEFPEMAADWYKSHGYDFLALSDHNLLMAGDKLVPIDVGDRNVPSSVVEKCQKRFGDCWLQLCDENGKRKVKLKTYEEVRKALEEPGRFLLIQNEEISAKYNDQHVHINVINLAEQSLPLTGSSVTETMSMNLKDVGLQAERLHRSILTHANHPDWADHDITAEDLATASELRFFEVCNAGPWGRIFGDATHPGNEKLWDIANTIRITKMKLPPLYSIGSDDTHNYQKFTPEHANPGRAWIMVRADKLCADTLLDAMRRGDYYASTGVTLKNINFDAQQRTLAVEVQAEPGVHYAIEFIGTLEGTDPTGKPVEAAADYKYSKRPGRTYSPDVGKTLSRAEGTSATYKFTGKELYVRAAIRSDKPIPNAPKGSVQLQEAWSQPVGWEK